MSLTSTLQTFTMVESCACTRTQRGRRRIVAAAMIIGLVASCSSSDAPSNASSIDDAAGLQTNETGNDADSTPGATPEASAGQDTASAQDDAAETTDGDGVDGQPESLSDFLGVAARFLPGAQRQANAGLGDDDGQIEEQQRAVQQQIQRCMQEQGFAYVPDADAGLRRFTADVGVGLDRAAFAEQFGFGISTGFDSLVERAVDFSEEVDENAAHLETLSEGEADAWLIALDGVPPERNASGQLIDPETGEVIAGRGRGVRSGGCRGQAETEVFGDFSALASLSDEFAELEERIQADPRVVEISTAWQNCMSDAGFDYDDEQQARTEIQQTYRPLLFSFFGRGPGQGGADEGGGDQEGAGQQGGAPGDRLQNALSELVLTDEQEAELATLQQTERSVAVASVGCDDGNGDELEEIRLRYEREFVQANREVLESIGN